MGDHTETVQLDYDPAIISYEQLLKIFWEDHDPTSQPYSRQYLHAVFYHNTAQRDAAQASKSALEQRLGSPVETQIIPVKSFTMAEDYHQKYMLKTDFGLKTEMTAIYPDHEDFVNSTAVSRLNGYVGGYGTREQLLKELDVLGISSKQKDRLRTIVRR
ncbi:MAG: peptide-methionine (S)-S-oxide reductase [Desulfofustis sp. PB-SRB1]|mgnify:FL=1|jgi:peptide-methionine (S)-S-oxide reductase|nr:peptide-methionine (S)-S-oxide reductase [Desulfofustis sp. PB-SRB1]